MPFDTYQMVSLDMRSAAHLCIRRECRRRIQHKSRRQCRLRSGSTGEIPSMQISFGRARALVIDVLTKYGVAEDHASIVADHLVDAAAAGHPSQGCRGFSLWSSIWKTTSRPRDCPPANWPTTPLSSMALETTAMSHRCSASTKPSISRTTGVGFVGIKDTWFSGRLAYYVERAAHATSSPFTARIPWRASRRRAGSTASSGPIPSRLPSRVTQTRSLSISERE